MQSSIVIRVALFVGVGLVMAGTPRDVAAQQAEVGPKVGDVAPDFSLRGATRYGVLQDQVKLSSLRGQTVVLAFFPKARTQGCTVQMEAYRDQYASTFNGGRKVTVIGISLDPDTALYAWARDAEFPMLFASDAGGQAGTLYGTFEPQAKYEKRFLYVVGPDGRIAYKVQPFRQSTADAYTELAGVVDKLSPATGGQP